MKLQLFGKHIERHNTSEWRLAIQFLQQAVVSFHVCIMIQVRITESVCHFMQGARVFAYSRFNTIGRNTIGREMDVLMMEGYVRFMEMMIEPLNQRAL